MPLPSSGEISLNDIHTEILRSPANQTEASISDTSITNLAGLSGVGANSNYSFSQWYSQGNAIQIRPNLDLYTIPESIPNTPSNTATLVTGKIYGNAGTYYYELDHITTSNADFTNGSSNLTGSVTINDQSQGSTGVQFIIDTLVDEGVTGEGDETFQYKVRFGASNGPLENTSSAITVTAASGPSQWSISPNTTSQNEGASVTWTATGFNIPDGTTYYLHLTNNTASTTDFSQSFPVAITINSNNGTTNLTANNDNTTEGSESYGIQLRAGTSGSSTLLATSTQTVTISDTSTTPISYSITPSSNNMNEGVSMNFTFTGAPSTTHYWTINHGTTVAADFASTGNNVIMDSNGNATYNSMITTIADATTEGSQTFSVDLRTGGFNGTVVANSGTITVNDTSTTPVSLTEDAYYELNLLRTITGQGSYWAGTADSLSAYAGQKGRVVFHYNNGSSSTSYRGDIQVDNVQFDGTAYNFENTGHSWVTSVFGSSNATGINLNSLATFNNNVRNYASLAVGEQWYRWNVDSGGTPSGSTGLSSAASGSYYTYVETTGSLNTLGAAYTMASPLVQLSNSVGNLGYGFARYGSNIGTLRVYWAENKTTDPYPPAAAATVSGPLIFSQGNNNLTNWIDGQYSSNTWLTAYGQYTSAAAQGDTCRLLIAYISGNNWDSDLQLDDWWANATSTSAGSGQFPLYIDSSQAQYSNTLTGYSSSNWNTSFNSPSTTDIQNIYNNTTSWTNLSTAANTSTWAIDSGGTPSSNTGLTSLGSGSYTYYEASSNGYPYKMRLLRSKQFTATANRGFRGRIGAYGANIGKMRVYIVVE